MTRTAVSISDKDKNTICNHFVRCKQFFVFDRNTNDQKIVTNPYNTDVEDAGIKAIKYLKALGVDKFVAGDFGIHVQEEARRQNIQLIIVDTDKITLKTLTEKS